MKKSIFTFCLLLMTSIMMAQYRVALHSGGNVSIFGGATAFADAYTAAVDGDIIYLPGGNLTYPGTIDKSLTIYGVGHYPAATTATDKTLLTGNLSIGENADNLHLEGIHLTGTLTFNTNAKVDDVVIKRCRLGAINYPGDRTTPSENNIILESVINTDVRVANTLNLIISNNIIGDEFFNGYNTGITNNVFLTQNYHYYFRDTDNCNVTNNIFVNSGYFINNCNNNSFSYNLFINSPGFGANTFTNNHVNVDMTTVFQTMPSTDFEYTNDYSLLPAAQSTYLGFDGVQAGIYGGNYPFKVNSVPTNPAITAKSVSPQTDNNGEINVQITAEAQSN